MDPDRSSVELTPLGVYGTREYILGIGCEAPLTAAHWQPIPVATAPATLFRTT
jgi:hypothetical protein